MVYGLTFIFRFYHKITSGLRTDFYFQILSQNYEWFTDAFDKMPKDGREMQWRQMSEHEAPEMLNLPDGLDDK